MTEYRIQTRRAETQPVEKSPRSSQNVLRPALWVILAIAVVGNAATSFTGSVALQAGLGAVTAASAIGLIVGYFRRR